MEALVKLQGPAMSLFIMLFAAPSTIRKCMLFVGRLRLDFLRLQLPNPVTLRLKVMMLLPRVDLTDTSVTLPRLIRVVAVLVLRIRRSVPHFLGV